MREQPKEQGNNPVIPLEWEQLDEGTSRAKVFGGWLIKCERYEERYNHKTYRYENPLLTETVIFIPDLNHEWRVE